MTDHRIPNPVLSRHALGPDGDAPGEVGETGAELGSGRSPTKRAVHRVLLLGPARVAVSGVSTHINQLIESTVSTHFGLSHFQVGREGRGEGRAGTVLRVIASPFAFAWCLIQSRPQIVHINTSFEPKGYWRDLAYLAVAKLARCRVVYQVHGGALPGEFFAGSRVLTALLRRVLSWPDSVVLLAKSEMTAYASFAPRARLVRIPNAVSAGEADLSPERYAGNRQLDIVYVGRLAANKGIFETIEAVRILRDRGVEACLTVAGTGAEMPAVCRAIEAAGLSARARVVGAVFGAAKEQLWDRAHVLAFPTYHREGLPYALLECMAAGAVPVISPVGAIPDVVQDEVHGLFVPSRNPEALADALERLAGDRELLRRLATAAHARVVKRFSVARMAAEFKVLYESLVERTERAP